jgi:putative DNA primase/helicase
MPTRELYPATPDFWSYNALDFDFQPDAAEPEEWLSFLQQLWSDDQRNLDIKSIDTLQELFGYCLTADTSQQKIFLFVGPKRSGKGTIGRVLTRLLGQANVASPTLQSLCGNFGLQPLIGKSAALIGDARIGQRHDQAAIAERLLSISGEDAITIDRKNLLAWTGRLGVRFVILTNELPRLPSCRENGASAYAADARSPICLWRNRWDKWPANQQRDPEKLRSLLAGRWHTRLQPPFLRLPPRPAPGTPK